MNLFLHQSDHDLIEAFRKGTPGAGDELVRRYYPRVLQLSLQCLHDPHDAQDVAQEVFFKIIVCRKLACFRGESRLWTWIYRITLNACRTQHVQKQRATYFDLDAGTCDHLWPGSLLPEEHALATERRQRLERVIKQLPQKYQKALRITCLEDRSCYEAARILNVPLPTLRVHINRGKGMLQRLLHSRLPNDAKSAAGPAAGWSYAA